MHASLPIHLCCPVPSLTCRVCVCVCVYVYVYVCPCPWQALMLMVACRVYGQLALGHLSGVVRVQCPAPLPSALVCTGQQGHLPAVPLPLQGLPPTYLLSCVLVRAFQLHSCR